MKALKTIVTIWYMLYSFDGVECIEGPTPEEITINHTDTSSREDIIALAVMVFEMESDPSRVKIHGEPEFGITLSAETCRFPDTYDHCFVCPANSECTVGDAWEGGVS